MSSDDADARPAGHRRRRPPTSARCTRPTVARGTRRPSGTRAWFDEAVDAHRARRHQPVRRGGRAHRRPARSVPPGDPPAVRRRSRHALALEPGRRRGRRHRHQPADARAGDAPERRDRRPRPLDRVRRARHPARARRDRRPRLHRARVAASGSRTSMRGPRSSPGSSPRGPVRPLRRATRRSGSSTSTRTGVGSPRTTTTSAARRPRRAGRPSTSTTSRSTTPTRLEVRPRVDPRRGHHRAARRRPAPRARRRAPDRLVGRPSRRPPRGPRAGSRCRSRSSPAAPIRCLARRTWCTTVHRACGTAARPPRARPARCSSKPEPMTASRSRVPPR